MFKTKRTPPLDSALLAGGRGWLTFPVHSVGEDGTCSCRNQDCAQTGKHPMTPRGFKDATIDEATIRTWWRKHPNANIGIATGSQSGLLVLDIDPEHGGLTSLNEFEDENGLLPDGPQVQTGRRGFHIYFVHPGGNVKSKIGVIPGIDVRADGAYVVGSGSIHKSGRPYSWVDGKTPEEIALPDLPEAFLRLIRGQVSPQLHLEFQIPEGQRNTTLASLAGVMHSRRMTPQAIEVALLEENRQRCSPPLSESEVIGIARSIARYPAGDVKFLSAFSKDDVQKERIDSKFRTGKQIASDVPPKVPWIVPSVRCDRSNH